MSSRLLRLVRVPVDQSGQDGHGNNSQVEAKGPILQVVEIKFDAFLDGRITAPAIDLRPPGDADLQTMPVVVAPDFLQEFLISVLWATRFPPAPQGALPVATAARKKTCTGRGRNAALAISGSAQKPQPRRAHGQQRCAAVPGCRKCRNAHKASCETARAAREIASGKFRSATAGRPRR
jgi:hypothetical protein